MSMQVNMQGTSSLAQTVPLSTENTALLQQGIEDATKNLKETMQWLQEPNYRLHLAVARAIGLHAYEKLPVLDLQEKTGPTGYIDFVQVSDVSAPVMKGVDEGGRAFIVLRYIDRLSENPTEKRVEVIFQRSFSSPETNSATSCSKSLFWGQSEPFLWNGYFQRLLKHEPCGRLGISEGLLRDGLVEKDPKTTEDGKPVVELL